MTDPQHEETFADTERKLRETITTLRAQLAEAQAERDALAKVIDPEDNRPALMARIIIASMENKGRAYAAEARADRAEAALAAQIEADAEICDGMHSSTIYYEAHECANAIRNQPHDRTALDRYREKVLREAAALPHRTEKLGGQSYAYVRVEEILALISPSCNSQSKG